MFSQLKSVTVREVFYEGDWHDFYYFGFLGNVFGEETYTITGDISFQYDGDIYIRICTMEEWAEFL